jgi:aminopeptidase N
MLRNYLGDSAFFKGLNLYLNTYKYGNAEAHQLRLMFEQVSGKDLNWFFNQWYFNSGNPALDISYNYEAASQTAKVFIKQIQSDQKIFALPFAIDIYHGKDKVRYNVKMDKRQDTFSFRVNSKPDLINVDAEKMLLTEKVDNKTTAEFIHQYLYAGNYLDRREAIQYCIQHLDQPSAKSLLTSALNDKFHGLRNYTMRNLTTNVLTDSMIATIESIAKEDDYRPNRARAIELLGGLKKNSYYDFFVQNITDSSYSVAGAALSALAHIDENKAISFLPDLKKDAKDDLKTAIAQVELLTKTDDDFKEMYGRFVNADPFTKFKETFNFITYLRKVQNVENFKKGLDTIISFRNRAAAFSNEFKLDINKELAQLKAKKEEARATSQNKEALEEEISYLTRTLEDSM